MTASLKKQQKIISGLSETVKHLGYDIREVRDGVARSSNAGSGTSKSPQNYTGTISDLPEEIRVLVINHKKGIAISDATIRNFHKKLTKNPKEDTLDSLKLWISKQNGEIDTEPESEEDEEINDDS
ncbi:9526_t:CDS:2 [Ambispora gerdemannii]|uniref:9526_t:CDS:1 n=1 Tax=Ambispora gerdemannii TaxID=144530 RepID=A0A9N9CSK9_9GLOM|nr:9526_t:CDS:2 [Ambispora gerdemannii]